MSALEGDNSEQTKKKKQTFREEKTLVCGLCGGFSTWDQKKAAAVSSVLVISLFYKKRTFPAENSPLDSR